MRREHHREDIELPASLLVSIINYRTGELTQNAVHSVLEALGSRLAKVVVVDNASGDGSAEQLGEWIARRSDARVQLLRSERNSGFSGGHNQGMAVDPEADFHLLLNSDASLRPGFFEALLTAAQAHPGAGLFAPRLEWEDGRVQVSCFRFASPTSELIRGAASAPVTRLLRKRVTSLGLEPDPKEIEWASFACILLRGEMVRSLGPMDEGYFLYFEDSEYALRAVRAGWGIRYVPDARAVHYRGGSGPVKKMQSAKKRLPAYFYRSRTRFLRQAHGALGPLAGNMAWMLGRFLALMRPLMGKPVPASHDKEWRDIWQGFLHPLKPDAAPEVKTQ